MDLKKHQNPDGSYNGVTALSELTGISRKEVESVFDEVKANSAKLNTCGYHEFTINPDLANPDSPMNRSVRYKCVHCGGKISETMWRWHEIGRRPR